MYRSSDHNHSALKKTASASNYVTWVYLRVVDSGCLTNRTFAEIYSE